MRSVRPWMVILVSCVVVGALGATGCGGDSNNETNTGKLRTITSGKLKVGSDIPYPPFELGQAPNYQGLEVDVVNEIAKKLDLHPRFVDTPFATIFSSLAQGKFDMVASATIITPERKKQADFSDPYFPADQSLIVNKGSNIKTVGDLKDKVVGAQRGTTGADYANNNTDAKAVRTYDLIDDAFNALEAGQVDAVIHDCPVSKYAERAHKGLLVVSRIQTNRLYAFAFPKGSDALRIAINQRLEELKKSGRLGKLTDKWVGTHPCAGLPGTQ